MERMAIFNLEWGGDFSISPSGGLNTANGWPEARQLIVRAILTNPSTTLPSGAKTPPDYIFAPFYGAGLGLYVGQDMNGSQEAQLTSKIRSQVMSTSFVDQRATPAVSFAPLPNNGYSVRVSVPLKNHQTGTIVLQTE